MSTISTHVPRIDLRRLPAANSQWPAQISRSVFLSRLPSSSQSLQLDIDMDDGTNDVTDMDIFGAGTGSSEFPQANASSPATPVTSKRVAASEEASSGTKRARLDDVTSNSINGSTTTHNGSTPTQNSSTPTPKEKKIPQFAVGYVGGGKPKAADYEDVVQALLLRAMHEYESRIVGVKPYPDSATQSKWTKICWKEACCVAAEDYSMTERMSKMVCI